VTTGATVVRIVLGTIGALMLLSGVALSASVGVGVGAWLIVSGSILLIAVIIESSRYRSQAAERGSFSPGPGGGETGPLERRFAPTAEIFVDPTSNHRMRVYVDTRTGERRYVAEG